MKIIFCADRVEIRLDHDGESNFSSNDYKAVTIKKSIRMYHYADVFSADFSFRAIDFKIWPRLIEFSCFAQWIPGF